MRLFSVLLIALIAVSTPPLKAQTEKRTCFDSQRVRNWIVIDDETLLIDAGRKKYRMYLRDSCSSMSTSATLRFKGDPISGRVCGSLDAIGVEGEYCRISRIEEIDKQTFDDSQNKKKLSLKVKKT